MKRFSQLAFLYSISVVSTAVLSGGYAQAEPTADSVAGCAGLFSAQENSFSLPSLSHADLRAQQRLALETFKNSKRVQASLVKVAEYKLRFYSDASTASGSPDVLDALQVVLKTFTNPHNDLELRVSAIEALGTVPTREGERAIQMLLPLARGAQFVASHELSHSVRMINEISSKIGGFPLRTQTPEGLPRKSVRDTLLHEPISQVVPLSAGGVNTTLVIYFQNGTRGIFKPRAGEAGFSDKRLSSRWVLYTREVIAHTLVEHRLDNARSRALGKSRVKVPETVEVALVHDGTSYGLGSLQVFEEGFVSIAEFSVTHPDTWENIRKSREWGETEARIRTIDWLQGNHDRLPNSVHTQGNWKNIMVPEDMKGPEDLLVAMIDNGLGRPRKPEFNIQNAPLRAHVPKDLAQAIFNFDETDFRNAYQNHLSVEGINDFVDGLKQMKARLRHGP